jgi:hypothetical protein
LCNFLSHKYCKSFFLTSLVSFDFTSSKKLDFSYCCDMGCVSFVVVGVHYF